jgi:hypothetical protein
MVRKDMEASLVRTELNFVTLEAQDRVLLKLLTYNCCLLFHSRRTPHEHGKLVLPPYDDDRIFK